MFPYVPVYPYHECTRHDCRVPFRILGHWFGLDWYFGDQISKWSWGLGQQVQVPFLCPKSSQIGMFGARQVLGAILAGVNIHYRPSNRGLVQCWTWALFFSLAIWCILLMRSNPYRCSAGHTAIFSWNNMKHIICHQVIRLPNRIHGKPFKHREIPFSERLWSFGLM